MEGERALGTENHQLGPALPVPCPRGDGNVAIRFEVDGNSLLGVTLKHDAGVAATRTISADAGRLPG